MISCPWYTCFQIMDIYETVVQMVRSPVYLHKGRRQSTASPLLFFRKLSQIWRAGKAAEWGQNLGLIPSNAPTSVWGTGMRSPATISDPGRKGEHLFLLYLLMMQPRNAMPVAEDCILGTKSRAKIFIHISEDVILIHIKARRKEDFH